MLIQWIIIAILVLIGFWYIKMEHHSRKAKVVIIVIIVALLYFSMVGVFSSKEVDLTSPRGIVNGVYVYFGWVGRTMTGLWDIGTNTVRTVGNAIRINNNSKEDSAPRLIGPGK